MNEKSPLLKDKVALITGAAGAIGYAVAQALLENGCSVAVSDLPGQRLDDFTADLKKQEADRVIGVELDVTNKDSVTNGF